jgi:hypothetical protein
VAPVSVVREREEQCASFTGMVYGLVPAGREASIADILQQVPHGNTVRGRVRAALMRLSNKGVIIRTRRASGRGGGDPLLFYRVGDVLSAEELTARLRPPRAPSEKKIASPQHVETRISPWFFDEFGIATRRIEGVAAPIDDAGAARRREAGRRGGIASAIARKATTIESPETS